MVSIIVVSLMKNCCIRGPTRCEIVYIDMKIPILSNPISIELTLNLNATEKPVLNRFIRVALGQLNTVFKADYTFYFHLSGNIV